MTTLPWPLLPASRTIEAVNRVGRWLYTSGLRRARAAGVPVVSVGNIACGGTGKTPIVAALARTLRDAGYRPAILTRGYRREGSAPAVTRGDAALDWRAVGDEPALLAASLHDVPVVVDADRVRGAATAVGATGASHLLLDDGFQHWRLARDLDLVVVDAADPLSSRSPRREGPRTLGRADVILVANARPPLVDGAVEQLRRVVPETPVVALRTVVRGIRRGRQSLPPAVLRGVRVVAVAGIASPERFFATLADLGADVAQRRAFPDHHAFTRAEIESIIADAARAHLEVVMTGKDAVKVPADLAEIVHWVEIDVECCQGTFLDLLRPVLTPVG